MMQWLSNNIGTVLISLELLAVVARIICSLIRKKREGKSSFGCNCADCALHGSCHAHNK